MILKTVLNFAYTTLIRPLAFLNKNPILLRTNSYHLVYFGLFAAIGATSGLSVFLFYLYAKGAIDSHAAIPITAAVILGGIIGIKLFHAISQGNEFFSDPLEYLNHTTMYNQGGILGVIFASAVIVAVLNIDLMVAFDALAIAGCLCLFWGRLGCYNYGCCFGTPTNNVPYVIYTHPKSKVVLTHPELENVPIVPTQLYTAYFDLFMFMTLLILAWIYRINGLVYLWAKQVQSSENSRSLSFLGLVVWFSYFASNGLRLNLDPFQVPFTLAQWYHFIFDYPQNWVSISVAGIVMFFFCGLHGQKLGKHVNI